VSAQILLVEDDPALLAILRAAAEYGGFTNRTASTGEEAIAALEAGGLDAVLLDLGLPDYDGRELLVALRRISDIPIIVVSGRGTERDKIEALDLGADDFVPKPFLPGELLARVRAALRRYSMLRRKAGDADARQSSPDRDPTRFGALTLDPLDQSATLRGRKINFNDAEYRVLQTLAASGGEIVSRPAILESLYGDEPPSDSNIVDVYISRVRAKLRELLKEDDLISNVRGQGWRFRAPA
jgi:DNA-binding response OmpR family regulator